VKGRKPGTFNGWNKIGKGGLSSGVKSIGAREATSLPKGTTRYFNGKKKKTMGREGGGGDRQSGKKRILFWRKRFDDLCRGSDLRRKGKGKKKGISASK